MDVAYQSDQVAVSFANDRLIASLEEMTELIVRAVEILGVGLLKPLHEASEGYLARLEE
jgi:hypothetical protein